MERVVEKIVEVPIVVERLVEPGPGQVVVMAKA